MGDSLTSQRGFCNVYALPERVDVIFCPIGNLTLGERSENWLFCKNRRGIDTTKLKLIGLDNSTYHYTIPNAIEFP